MIFVDQDRINLDPEWQRKAAEASASVRTAFESANCNVSTLINSKSSIWSDLGAALGELSWEKCWYCESRETRSDMPIDHYRPKNQVTERSDHPGYWWLAFEWTNYRYSCTYCNSRRLDKQSGTAGGKQAQFPLIDEADRAMDPSQDVSYERPILLDPTDPIDPGLLFFDDLGKAIPHPLICAQSPDFFLRAKMSIDILNLNHRRLQDERLILRRKLKRLFDQALIGLQDLQSSETSRFRDAMRDLYSATADTAELAATARAYLRGRRADGPDAEKILSFLHI